MAKRQKSAARSGGAERRRVPRIDVSQRDAGAPLLAEGGVAGIVLNISERGFLISGAEPFHRGDVRDFRFAVSVGDAITIRGRIVRTGTVVEAGIVRHTAGVQFNPGVRIQQRIARLLEAIRAPASRL